MADAFILLRYPFESNNAKELNKKIFETIYYGALTVSYTQCFMHVMVRMVVVLVMIMVVMMMMTMAIVMMAVFQLMIMILLMEMVMIKSIVLLFIKSILISGIMPVG